MEKLDKMPEALKKRAHPSAVPFRCEQCNISFAWEPFTAPETRDTVVCPSCRCAEQHPEMHGVSP